MYNEEELSGFLNGKTEYTLALFRFIFDEISKIGTVKLVYLKSMIALEGNHRFAHITQLGKNFVYIVLPFPKPFQDNLCFSKIANVPGTSQYNHHLKVYFKEDLNEEVISFFRLAYNGVS